MRNTTTRRRFVQGLVVAASGAALKSEVEAADPPATPPASAKPTIARTKEVMQREPQKHLWTLHQSATSRTNLVQMKGKAIPHLHPDAEHSLYVISGTVKAKVAGEEFTLNAGDYISIPAGVSHGYDVPGDEPALLLSMDAPPYDPAKTVRLDGKWK